MAALQRPIHKMPHDVKAALVDQKLIDAYLLRPPYQQNDYISWITRAKQAKTRQKRLNQMLRELADGTKYMNMEYHSKL